MAYPQRRAPCPTKYLPFALLRLATLHMSVRTPFPLWLS
jgi:hypothetical protein